MSGSPKSLLASARKRFHARLLNNVLKIDSDGIPSNADRGSKTSKVIAKNLAVLLGAGVGDRLAGQTSGSKFESLAEEFLRETFLNLQHIRPGDWIIEKIGNRNRLSIANYEQYSHLIALHKASKNNPELAVILGNDYTITPDVIIARNLLEDNEINAEQKIIDGSTRTHAAVRFHMRVFL